MVSTIPQAKYIESQAKERNISIPKVLCVSEILKNEGKKYNFDKILIDEAPYVLKAFVEHLLNSEIDTITLTTKETSSIEEVKPSQSQGSYVMGEKMADIPKAPKETIQGYRNIVQEYIGSNPRCGTCVHEDSFTYEYPCHSCVYNPKNEDYYEEQK